MTDERARARAYRMLADLIASGITDPKQLADACGLRVFECEAELQQRALRMATKARQPWKGRRYARGWRGA